MPNWFTCYEFLIISHIKDSLKCLNVCFIEQNRPRNEDTIHIPRHNTIPIQTQTNQRLSVCPTPLYIP